MLSPPNIISSNLKLRDFRRIQRTVNPVVGNNMLMRSDRSYSSSEILRN